MAFATQYRTFHYSALPLSNLLERAFLNIFDLDRHIVELFFEKFYLSFDR